MEKIIKISDIFSKLFPNDKLFDLLDDKKMDLIFDQIIFDDLGNSEDIVIDLCECQISYETAYLIGKIIKKIHDPAILKTIHIKSDYDFISNEARIQYFSSASSPLFSTLSADESTLNYKLIFEE